MKLVLLAALATLVPAAAVAATFSVNSNADIVDAQPGDGKCETVSGNGVCTLRAAVQEAGATAGPNEIIIPAGTYKLSATPACSYQLVNSQNTVTQNMSALCVLGTVTITGSGSDSTIIDAGGSGGATCCGDYPSARGMVTSLRSIVTLTGVTIQNGVSSGGTTYFGGAAINNQGNLKISNCVFTANIGNPGGTIWNAGTLLVDGTAFTGNSSTVYGGAGLYNASTGLAEVSNSSFTSNVAGSTGSNGAAIINQGTLKVLSSTMSNNVASYYGGALFNSGRATLTNVTIASNQAYSAGAILNAYFAVLNINNSTIALNESSNANGGIVNGQTVNVANSIIAGNTEYNNTGTSDCSGDFTSQGHNLMTTTRGCNITGATSTDLYNVPAGLGPLASNGGSTQTMALLSTSKALNAGDPATPGSGGTACAAADARGVLRPQGTRCDIGAFESSNILGVLGISPTHSGNTGLTQMVVSGNGFALGATVTLRRSGQADIAGSQVVVQLGNASLAAVFSVTGAAPGTWDVVVNNPDGTTAVLPSGFTINPGGAPSVWAEVGGPAIVRPDSTATYFVSFGNRGDAEALEVPIVLAVPSNLPLRLNVAVQPPPAQAGQVATDWPLVPIYTTPGPENGFVNVPLLLPSIPPGFSGALRFDVSVPSSLHEGDYFQVYGSNGAPLVQVGGDTTAIVNQFTAGALDYAQTNLHASISASVSSTLNQYVSNQIQLSIAAARAQFTETAGSQPLLYSLGQLTIDAAQFAAANSTTTQRTAKPMFSRMSQSTGSSGSQICVTPNGAIVVINVGGIQPPGASCKDPENALPPPPCGAGQKSTDANPCLPPDGGPLTPAGCRDLPNHHVSTSGGLCLPNPGSGCSILLSNPLLGSDPKCTVVPIGTSVDPNAKSGPLGVGSQHFHPSGNPFHYTIEFQNQPTATLPAQSVVVTDALDTANLDLSTFSLGAITFGSYTITPPSGLQHYTGGVDLRPGLNLIVKVDAGLNPANGVVTWTFTSLDPDTEQLTTDPAAGFLPPDVAPPQGEGELLYSVRTKSGIANGTAVCNQATVVFDSNPPINTQNWCNTVDDAAPTTRVTQLPATESSESFNVQWSGIDAGAGIADYTIYFSDNGGAYVAWLSNTTSTSAQFTGMLGHTYAFYSIARDLVGNVEAAKSTYDTITTVGNSAPLCAADVSSQFSIVQGGFRFNNATQRFSQVVTITRTATASLAGPFAFAVQGLDADATLYNSAGVTSCVVAGSAYLLVNPGATWTSGQQISITVEFVDPKKTGITYKPVLLAGELR